jgi:anti-anti-sigma regulatory factor
VCIGLKTPNHSKYAAQKPIIWMFANRITARPREMILLEHTELAISITEFNRTPLMTISGRMDAWHGPTIDVALQSFVDAAERDLILDLARLEFSGADAASALVKSIRQLRPEICIHAVADTQLAHNLRSANFGPCISISTSFAEIAEGIRVEERYLTSRWTPQQVEEEELPLAA